MKNTRGFTLIELMIVVAIVGILIAISVPSYQSSVLKSHRADAQASLTDISARQERFLAQNNTYTAELSANTGLNMGSTTSKEGYYSLTAAACAGGTIANCYLLTATAVGGQASDGDCGTLTLTSTSVKSGTTAGNECW